MSPDRYYVNGKEVSKEDYISAERRNGFHSKFGPNEIATSSFSNSETGDHGRVSYGSSSP